MNYDPAGLYARLDLDPSASEQEVAAAFRRKARVLHPDVAVTGDAAAFIRMKAAYDILSDVDRRAAYDRAARAAAEVGSVRPAVQPEPVVVRGPRFSDLPAPLWAALGGLFCVAAVMAVVQLSRPVVRDPAPVIRPFAPSVPARPAVPPSPPAVPAGGETTHYVLPGASGAVLWRRDATRDIYVPAGLLPAFSPVDALKLIPQHGLLEIRLASGDSGFVDAVRLTPGDGAAAHRAYCAYNAGMPPRNGEVLDRHGEGSTRLDVNNRGSEPAVVKLRDTSGKAAATLFVAPGARASVADLPDGVYRPDVAVGELWSRACGSFAAGMRAQRFAGYASPSGLSPLVIPPDLSVAPVPVDIPEAEFGRE